MINTYDIAYGLAVGASAPYWLIKPSSRRKVLQAFSQRMGDVPIREGTQPAVMIHAVSLGEINATKMLVARLRELKPDLHIIISTTTETGYARAMELYGNNGRVAPQHLLLNETPSPFTVIRYPLDFTSAISKVLDNLRPSVVALMELELWPNFISQCARRKIPVVLLNGRITDTSFGRYKWIRPVVKRMLERVSVVCAQDQTYAKRFVELGARPERVQVTGTMKFDTATVADRVDGDEELAAALRLRSGSGDRIWVCGSTGPGEEEIVLRQFRTLLTKHARLRLIIVPRKPERFEEVANLITAAGFAVLRRSHTLRSSPQNGSVPPSATLLPPVILGDTMGELRKFYSLADVVFVGRTLVDLGPRQHGSDMIEPAALAKPVVVGPYTGNFADAMSRFKAADAIMEVQTADQLGEAVSVLLSSPQQAKEMGRKAQQVVINEKGATERHAWVLLT
ncbi:MAG TPA: 3-deoxy-D-manno-octulosonic acid transferase [Tepidisphaeraceae bacterium]|jgi:3-deoxy-D-manno-octulosonic-acid transferase|nr:3-deoxy-D-manno-octulosonic acid transferase [Tepidisphaeraceae bacterium]